MHIAKSLINRYAILIMMIVFYIFLVFVFYIQTKSYTITKSQEKIEDLLLNVQALRSFNSNFQKEEVYRLQAQGFIYEEYFSPKLLSSTYVSKEVNKIYNTLREERGQQPIIIRFASSNPRNPQNLATSKEDEILEQFNNQTITNYHEIIKTDLGDAIYYAVPTKVTTAECMKCHSDPSLAPADLVNLYGDSAGFYEHNGEIRALLSTIYPIGDELKVGMFYFYILSLVTLVVFIVLGFVSYKFLRIIDNKQDELENINKSLETIVQEQTKELATKSEYLNLIFNSSPNIIMVSDGKNMVFANDTFFNIFTKCDTIDDFNRYYGSLDDFILTHLEKQSSTKFEITDYIDKNTKLVYNISNTRYYFNMTTTQISFKDKDLYLHVLADITELELTKKTLEDLSIKDDLTLLYNRRFFNKVYDKELKRAKRNSDYLAFAIIDIDYFKMYNDTFGHIAGDNALKHVSEAMKRLFHRNSEFVFRMGGEEFGVIMTNIEPMDALNQILKLQESIKDLCIKHPTSKIHHCLTISVGLYVSKVYLDDDTDFYKEADLLLYQAKEKRDCVISNLA